MENLLLSKEMRLSINKRIPYVHTNRVTFLNLHYFAGSISRFEEKKSKVDFNSFLDKIVKDLEKPKVNSNEIRPFIFEGEETGWIVATRVQYQEEKSVKYYAVEFLW